MTVHNHMAPLYVKYYQDGKFKLLITTIVSKILLIELYNILINSKEILPIELLLQPEKEKLRSECLETGLNFNNREMNNACRILYTLKNIV